MDETIISPYHVDHCVSDAERHEFQDRLAVAVSRWNAAQAELVALAAEAVDSGVWAQDGIRSVSHYLTWQAGVSAGTAQAWIDMAEKVAGGEHPATVGLFESGQLTLDQARAAVKAPPHTDEQVAALAGSMTVGQIRTTVRAARVPADPDPDGGSEQGRVSFDDEGRFRLTAVLDPDRGRIVEAALSAARDRLFHDRGEASPTPWADALVDVCRRSLNGETEQVADRHHVVLFLDPSQPVQASWADGTAVPDALNQLLTCDGTVSPVFVQNAVPLSVGRTLRVVPNRTRRVILRRDRRRCQHPMCSSRRGLQVHHIRHWADGGRTDSDNLITLCARCHRRHHLGEFTIHGDPNTDIEFRARSGLKIQPPPHRQPCPPPPGRSTYIHPTGERLDWRSLSFPAAPEPPTSHVPPSDVAA